MDNSKPELVGVEESVNAVPYPVEEGHALKWSGDSKFEGKWVHFAPTPESVAETIIGRKVTREDGSGFIAEDCTERGAFSEIFIDGKSYLMIDNSGPEQLNPYALQNEITQLHEELDEAYQRLSQLEPTTEPERKVFFIDVCDDAINPIDYPMGTAMNPVDDVEDATKMAISGMMTFGEMADSVVHGSYSGCEYAGIDVDPAYNPPAKSDDFFIGAGTCYGIPEIDLSGISLVSAPMPGNEITLVSKEEADYDNAMSMIGK